MVTERFYSLILISQSLADSVSLLPQDLGRYLASVRVQQNVQTLLPTCCPADPSLNRQLRRHVVLCLHRKQQLEWKCLLNWLKGWKQGCHLQNNSASVHRNIRDLSETALCSPLHTNTSHWKAIKAKRRRFIIIVSVWLHSHPALIPRVLCHTIIWTL